MHKVKLLLAITTALLIQTAAAELPKCKIIDLDAGGETESIPNAINDAGQVVGNSRGIADRQGPKEIIWSDGFIWDEANGLFKISALLNETVSWNIAYDINNNGRMICARQVIEINPRLNRLDPFIWSAEDGLIELTELSNLPRRNSRPILKEINDNGQVLGQYLWDKTNGIIEIKASDDDLLSLKDLNNDGFVVGYRSDPDMSRLSCAFIWNTETGITSLGSLSQYSSYAFSINNNNMVVGTYEKDMGDGAISLGGISNDSRPNHAFVWTKSTGMVDIHDSNFLHSRALKINDIGQAIGILSETLLPYPPSEIREAPFIWEEGLGMINLNDLLPADSDWDYLERVSDINNKGQIVGYGMTTDRRRHGFVLTLPANFSMFVKIRRAIEECNSAVDSITAAMEYEEAILREFVKKHDHGKIGKADKKATAGSIHSIMKAMKDQKHSLVTLKESIKELEKAADHLENPKRTGKPANRPKRRRPKAN